jgi:hypothetical protein
VRAANDPEVVFWMNDPACRCSGPDSPNGAHRAQRGWKLVSADEEWLLSSCQYCHHQIWRATSENSFDVFAGLWHMRDEMTDYVIQEEP